MIREVETGVYERVGFGTMDDNMMTASELKRIALGDEGNGESRPLLAFWLPLPAPRKVWKEFQLR